MTSPRVSRTAVKILGKFGEVYTAETPEPYLHWMEMEDFKIIRFAELKAVKVQQQCPSLCLDFVRLETFGLRLDPLKCLYTQSVIFVFTKLSLLLSIELG